MTNPAPPCSIVIFGAAGDLTLRLLMPSIYNLSGAKLLDPGTTFIGADHNDRSADAWRKEIEEALRRFASTKGSEFQAEIDEKAWSFVAERMDYVTIDFENDADYEKLSKKLDGARNVLFYLAVAPRFFEKIAQGLGGAGLLKEKEDGFRRIVVEKPFGRDVASARQLNEKLTSLASESQIYRIDHFLGKEAVQGLMPLRFASHVIEPLLNRHTVESVQITAAETVGVEERGPFYETTGALRDMIPNHLFSLMTLVAMERPKAYDAESVRDAKAALLDAVRPVKPEDAARGQYGAGSLEGKDVKAYRDEDRVAKDSRIETYAALRLQIDNDRWRDVPFYIRTGKRMASHTRTIAMMLRTPEHPIDSAPTAPHLLAFGTDPQRGLVQRFAAKSAGVELNLGRASSGFRYETTFDEPSNVGYETLLYHAMTGSPMLFQRHDMIDREWTIVQPVLDAWSKAVDAPEIYKPGSPGPNSADELLARDGNAWLDVEPLDSLGAEKKSPN